MSLPRVSSLSPPANARTRLAPPDSSILLKIFFAALAVRWAFALTMYALMGDDGLASARQAAGDSKRPKSNDALRISS